jgi:hypothetical protein
MTVRRRSADELLDLPMEDYSLSPPLMSIDSSTFLSGLKSMSVFGIALLVLIGAGVLGPAAIVTVYDPAHSLHDGSAIPSVEFCLTNLSSWNRFIRLSFVFVRNNNLSAWVRASVEYRVHFGFGGFDGHKFELHSEDVQNASIFVRADQRESARIITLSDLVIRYRTVNMTLTFITIPKEFSFVKMSARYGNPAHTVFQAISRVILAGFMGLTCHWFCGDLEGVPMRGWHFEQKLTVVLLVLGVWYNNPLYPLNAVRPSRAYIICDTIGRAAFTGYFRFFILALFDGLRFKNRKFTKWFFFPKVAFIVFLFLSSVVHGIYDDLALFGLPRVGRDHIEEELRQTEIGLFLVYQMWAVFAIVLAGCKVDTTERYKFGLYLVASGTALAVMVLVHLLFESFERLRQSSIRFVIGWAADNLFVLLMARLHWRDDSVQERSVHDASASNGDSELFVKDE